MGDPVRLLLTNAGAAGLLALLAWAASRVVRRPDVIHGLWLLALVRLVTPPLAPLPLLPAREALPLPGEPPSLAAVLVPLPPAADGPGARPSVVPPVGRQRASLEVGEAAAARPRSAAVGPALGGRTAAWALLASGALAIAGLTAWRFVRFGRLLGCARPAPPAVADRSSALATRIGLRRGPPVLLVPARIPPMLWPARGGPRLLLPEALTADLRAEELDALLAHELAHVRRRDHWVRLVEVGATALFWWYPVTWWARRALRRAEERCCDEWVLRLLPRSAEAYANGLLKSLAFVAGSSVPAVASGLGRVDDLEARLKEILMSRPAPRLAVSRRLALAAAAALGLAAFPTHARSSAAADEPATPAVASRAERPAPASPASASPATTRPEPAPVAMPAPAPAPEVAPARGGRDREPRAFEEQRQAIEEERQRTHRKQLELAQKQAQLEAEAQEAELRALADRLRREGKAEEAARVEVQIQLSARRAELQRKQLQLEVEQLALEAKARVQEAHLAMMEEDAREKAAQEARRALEEAGRARRRAEDEARVQHAIQAELSAAERRLGQAATAEDPARALREATRELARALARQIGAFERAAAGTPAQRAELDREIERLRAALEALQR